MGVKDRISRERGSEAGPTAQGQAVRNHSAALGWPGPYRRSKSPKERKLEAAGSASPEPQRAAQTAPKKGRIFPLPREGSPTAALSAPPRPPPQGAGAGGGAGRPGGGLASRGAAPPGPAPIPEGLRGEEERRTRGALHARRFPQSRVRARARPKSRGV